MSIDWNVSVAARGNEGGGQATFPSWRATANGGKKIQKRGKR